MIRLPQIHLRVDTPEEQLKRRHSAEAAAIASEAGKLPKIPLSKSHSNLIAEIKFRADPANEELADVLYIPRHYTSVYTACDTLSEFSSMDSVITSDSADFVLDRVPIDSDMMHDSFKPDSDNDISNSDLDHGRPRSSTYHSRNRPKKMFSVSEGHTPENEQQLNVMDFLVGEKNTEKGVAQSLQGTPTSSQKHPKPPHTARNNNNHRRLMEFEVRNMKVEIGLKLPAAFTNLRRPKSLETCYAQNDHGETG